AVDRSVAVARIGMGLVGAGFVGPHHVDAVGRLGFVDIVAVAGSSDASGQEKARAPGARRGSRAGHRAAAVSKLEDRMRGLFLTLVVAAAAVSMVGVSRAASPIPVMLLDGESAGPYHDWQHVTPVLKTILDETGLFETTVVTAPPANGDVSAFMP